MTFTAYFPFLRTLLKSLPGVAYLLSMLFSNYAIAQQCAPDPAPELIQNGDFSSGKINPATTDYKLPGLFTSISDPGRYVISNNNGNSVKPDFYGTGHQDDGNFMLVNGATGANIKVWETSVNVDPNTYYFFSAWICTLSPLSTEDKMAQLRFTINGDQLGNVFTAPNNYNVWSQM